jgi:quercetin dioxygenase-like cupin family protein/sugar lactone lactonase YvrE
LAISSNAGLHGAREVLVRNRQRDKEMSMTTQEVVFNNNAWGPLRQRPPGSDVYSRNTSPQKRVSPLTYSHTIGRTEDVGGGFRHPVAFVVNPRTRDMYVVNRGYSEYRNDSRRIIICTVDEEFITQFASGGSGDGEFFWPRGVAIDKEDNIYVSDEWLQRISIWSKDGDYVGKWGTEGSGDGEINRPAGIAFDSQDNLFVVDASNHRIQKFTKDGVFLAKWGSFGSGDGQFNLPWGIEIDAKDNVYVADWRNDRIQKFSPEGDLLMKFGSSGSDDGQLSRPSGVAVDEDGDIYVADWGNDRLQMFDPDGNHMYTFLGEATMSKWGVTKLDANSFMWRERETAWGLEREKYFYHPNAVEIDPDGRILVSEPQRSRIQVYTKNSRSSLEGEGRTSVLQLHGSRPAPAEVEGLGPVIRNFRSLYTPEGRARLIGLSDNPPTCTMGYSEILPGHTSTQHIHSWEHEIFIIKGAGTLVCDGKEYPVTEGDAIFIPWNVDHYILNNGGQGVIRRIEINPLIAAQSGGAGNTGGKGTGHPPVIRNYRALNTQTGNQILSTRDGVPNYIMLYNGAMAPGATSHADTGGHTHAWEHMVYVLEGQGALVCDGTDYVIAEGDGVLVPANVHHQWRNTSDLPTRRVTVNPMAAAGDGG